MRITLQYAKLGVHSDKGPAHKLDADTVNAGYYFETQADGNYETLTTSEIYTTHRVAMDTIEAFRTAGLRFELVDETE